MSKSVEHPPPPPASFAVPLLYPCVRLLRAAVLLAYVTAKCVADIAVYAAASPLKIIAPRAFSKLTDFLYTFNVAGLGSIGLLSAPHTLLRQHNKIFDSGLARCICIANHQSTADICMVGLLLHVYRFSSSMVWVMDKLLMYLPTGWTSLVHGDIFIVQSSQGGAPAIAEACISASVKRSWSLGRRCVTLFPEGGFFRKRHARSVEWLKRQDATAQHPKFTALPRSGGLCNILRVVGQDFEGVLDVTIRYEGGGALAPEIPSLFMGSDKAVFLDAEWIMKRDVPAGSDAPALHAWLTQRFIRKDDLMASSPALYTPISSICGPAFHLGVHVPVFLLILLCSFALGGPSGARAATAVLCVVAACLLTHTPGKCLVAMVAAAAAARAVMHLVAE